MLLLYTLLFLIILIVSYQQNIKEVCGTPCYTEHITFVATICRFMKKLII